MLSLFLGVKDNHRTRATTGASRITYNLHSPTRWKHDRSVSDSALTGKGISIPRKQNKTNPASYLQLLLKLVLSFLDATIEMFNGVHPPERRTKRSEADLKASVRESRREEGKQTHLQQHTSDVGLLPSLLSIFNATACWRFLK